MEIDLSVLISIAIPTAGALIGYGLLQARVIANARHNERQDEERRRENAELQGQIEEEREERRRELEDERDERRRGMAQLELNLRRELEASVKSLATTQEAATKALLLLQEQADNRQQAHLLSCPGCSAKVGIFGNRNVAKLRRG